MSLALGLIVVCLLLLVGCVYLQRRNERVYDFRTVLRDRVSRAAKQDIAAGRPWEWRHEEFGKISYNAMVFKFCKPLDSFWKDKSFLDPAKTGPEKK